MTITINDRTPEEIKKGLECCSPRYESKHWVSCSSECPFRNEGEYCRNVLHACNKKYIQLLEDGIDRVYKQVDALRGLPEKIQQLERERDEARNDLDTINYANTELHSAYEAMKRERDAAVEDIKAATLVGCHVCKHYYRPEPAIRKYACRKFGSFEEHDFIADDGSISCGAFEWRGVEVE